MGVTVFYLQGDGNLVLRGVSTNTVIWSAATNGRGGVRLNMQSDGNLVLRNASNSAVWSSQTNGKGRIEPFCKTMAHWYFTRPPVRVSGLPEHPASRGHHASGYQPQWQCHHVDHPRQPFTDPEVPATDNVDGNITSRIVRTGA